MQTETMMVSTFNSLTIPPRKLRSEVNSYSYQGDDSDIPIVISFFASLIKRWMLRNQTRASSRDTRVLVFDSNVVPDRTIKSYLDRIYWYTKTSPSVYVVAIVYIIRFCKTNPGFRISERNVHRLLITTVMVASKYVQNKDYRNSYYAEVGGLTTEELNRLEIQFLFMMGFKLHVDQSVFESFVRILEREVSVGGGH